MRTEEGFGFDECGISPQRVTAGIVLRRAAEGEAVLAVAARRFRSVFMDLGDDHNCIHANPWSGDLAAGGVTEWRGVLYLLRGSVEDVAAEVAKREGIT